eukprot:TRINITY_DN2838_c0_g1_i2.p1 TRINITY_DN2838_c0_g1~~TRINITY_DN2838_c0_g1_i2.p1  ORF type:complete len:244 (-),score=74.97 TRINITY_DN2838_c0_g1_i2:224-955(-)
MIRRPPRSTLSSSSAASDVYKRQHQYSGGHDDQHHHHGDEDNEGHYEHGEGDHYHDDADNNTHGHPKSNENVVTAGATNYQQDDVAPNQEQPLQEVDESTIEYTTSINQNRPVGTASARQKRKPQQQQNLEGAAGGEDGDGGEDRVGSARWERRRTSNDTSIRSPVRGNDIVERDYERILSDQQEKGEDDKYEAIGDRDHTYSDDDGFDAPEGGGEHVDDPYSSSAPYSDDHHNDEDNYSSEL